MEPPNEWEEPALFQQMEMLRSILVMSNKAIEIIRERKSVSSSLEAELTIRTPSQEILTALSNLSSPDSMEYSVADYFIVSKVTQSLVQSDEVSDSVSGDGSAAAEMSSVDFGGSSSVVQVIASPVAKTSGLGKCDRCWKWVCQEGEDLCERCVAVEGEPQQLIAQE